MRGRSASVSAAVETTPRGSVQGTQPDYRISAEELNQNSSSANRHARIVSLADIHNEVPQTSDRGNIIQSPFSQTGTNSGNNKQANREYGSNYTTYRTQGSDINCQDTTSYNSGVGFGGDFSNLSSVRRHSVVTPFPTQYMNDSRQQPSPHHNAVSERHSYTPTYSDTQRSTIQRSMTPPAFSQNHVSPAMPVLSRDNTFAPSGFENSMENQPYSSHSRSASQNNITTNRSVSTQGHGRILREHVTERDVIVPKRITVEETRERVVVIPEKVLTEKTVEEVKKVREKIIEVARPVLRETVVEYPEVEMVERVVEVPQKTIVERTHEVVKQSVVDVTTMRPREQYSSSNIDVPHVVYREVPVDQIVEVPEVKEEIIIKEVVVPRYVDVPTPVEDIVEVHQTIARNVPRPVVTIVETEIDFPALSAEIEYVHYPIYAPRFIEVPIPADRLKDEDRSHFHDVLQHVRAITNHAYPALQEVEEIAALVRKLQVNLEPINSESLDVQELLAKCD